MNRWILTSVLEFEDRYEGQVFHIGTKDECEKTASLIDALSYSGSERIVSSGFRWFPHDKLPLENGQLWQCAKEK